VLCWHRDLGSELTDDQICITENLAKEADVGALVGDTVEGTAVHEAWFQLWDEESATSDQTVASRVQEDAVLRETLQVCRASIFSKMSAHGGRVGRE